MATAADLLKHARLARHLARRARHVASFVSQRAHEESLNRYADEAEAKAAVLERQVQEPRLKR